MSCGQLITFQDLTNEENPLRLAIEPDSVDPIEAHEFYDHDEDQERVFKFLLDKCLSERLYLKDVAWQREERCYIFLRSTDGQEKRKEKWAGKREAHRTVCEVTFKTNEDKRDEILHCKHLAFTTTYYRFANLWFIAIKPDWFFSYDGFHKSKYSFEKIQYLKKKEKNQHVANHVRFITFFLRTEQEANLFADAKTYPHLGFGKLLTFDNAQPLDDEAWVIGETAEGSRQLKDSEGALFSDDSDEL